MWCFFQLDFAIKTALFFAQAGRAKYGRATPAPTDSFSKWFGTIVPANIPDSTAWWRRQARELSAICEDIESGLMQSMVTITYTKPLEHRLHLWMCIRVCVCVGLFLLIICYIVIAY